MILALAGGVGGARLARGLVLELPPGELMIVVNTADDFVHLGLHISPDIDSVIYTLAGRNNPETGWGIAGETWNFMEALASLGGETWFRLGDRDLATHVERTARLNAGESLSAVTRHLCACNGIVHSVVPMSDDPVRTVVHTSEGPLAFQDYFVRRRCEPRVIGFAFEGAQAAAPSGALREALESGGVRGVILCPSNPFVSIAPILAVQSIRDWFARRDAPVVAVSPIVGGAAVKGPAAKIFSELGIDPSAAAVAQHYRGLVDAWIIDEVDRALAPQIEALGARVQVTQTIMRSLEASRALARHAIDLLGRTRARTG